MAIPTITLAPVSFKGSLLSLSGTVNYNGDEGASIALFIDPKPTGASFGPIPIVVTDEAFSVKMPMARGTWGLRVVVTSTSGEQSTTTVTGIVLNTISSRVVMPGPPNDRDVISPPSRGATFADPESMAVYRAAISAAPVGTKRTVAAEVVQTRMATRYQLRIYQNNKLISTAEYTGLMTVESDGTDVYVVPKTQVSGSVLQSANLNTGFWTFELQGGVGYANVLQGTVGSTSDFDLILSHNPSGGESLTSSFKFVVPRSIDPTV